jgi:hypothetical protein
LTVLLKCCLPLLMALAPIVVDESLQRLVDQEGHGLADLLADLVKRADVAAVDLGLIETLVVSTTHALRRHACAKATKRETPYPWFEACNARPSTPRQRSR